MSVERYDCVVIETKTPDGTLFTTINELNNKPDNFQLQIGKAGSTLRAWTDAVATLATLAIQHGATIEDIITAISNFSSDRVAFTQGTTPIRSGPGGFVHALMRYKAERWKTMQAVLGANNDRRKSPPKFHNR